MSERKKAKALGVRVRLLLAFLSISMFSLVAAFSGLYSLSQVGGALNKITQQRVPEALTWLELSRKVETVVRAAPALLNVTTESARLEVSEEISRQIKDLEPLLERIIHSETEDDLSPDVIRFASAVSRNLESLNELVKKRLFLVSQQEKQLRELSQASNVAQRILSPSERILGAQMADWYRSGDNEEDEQLGGEQLKLAKSIIGLIPQQRASLLVDTIHTDLLKITDASTAEQIDVLIFPLRKSLQELTDVSQAVSPRAKRRLDKQITTIENLTIGPNSLSQVRRQELEIISKAEDLLAVNVRFSRYLTNRVDYLVNNATQEIETAHQQAVQLQNLNQNVLIGVAVLSLTCSLLIVWLYVGRNLIARLTALSESMLAIADGNLRAPLPEPGSHDEIGQMAEALVVFRDTAIEVEETNLHDIETARRRLVDAIENSSEGFVFFDGDDRLVICNSRYKQLLYPDEDIQIEVGTPFETLIRAAAENGHITEAEDRVDEWVEERMQLHRDPGEPRIQKRKSGQWILITERKTSDGGTVAIYSDITDLKRREEELTEKTTTLEQLSSQLAKYLSPQVYNSIFTGRREVKLASRRKRLTVFFSDLIDFTGTTERLESEDLTRLLNHYLTEMSEIALAHGATIDKYVGDAMVIFFGDPDSLGVREDALACASMAIEMRERMQTLERMWMEAGLEKPLKCRMGINTGICTVGNFGSEDRMDYTIIGSGVNLAARLEKACPPSEILISYETYSHIKNTISCQPEGKIQAKGFTEPVSTYRVIDFIENLEDGRRPIRASSKHMKLELEIEQMSAEERKDAARTLRETAAHLENSNPEKPPPE
ncbi:MAG: adenylate/guanylate cyclase domain-containing protein [Desulfofustis sp.]|jgi:adenylate cyclase